MTEAGFADRTIDYIESFVDSEFREIQHQYGGELMAFVEPMGEYVVGDNYLDLIQKLKKEDVKLSSVKITNIPRER